MSVRDPFLAGRGQGFEEDEFIAPPFATGVDEQQEAPPAKDRAWAILFKINMAITLISAVWFGGTGFKAVAHSEMLAGRRLSEDLLGTEAAGGSLLLPVFAGISMVALAWLFAWGLLLVLINCSSQILQVAYLGFVAMWALVVVSTLMSGQVFSAISSCLALVASVFFYVRRRGRIRFGAANLKVAALAIKSMPWTIRCSLIMAAVQVIWAIISGIAAAGSIVALETVTGPDGATYRAVDCRDVLLTAGGGRRSCQCNNAVVSYNSSCVYDGRSPLLVFFWLASLVWGGAVFQNVVAATVTGSVASWWFSPNDSRPVGGAFYRATHSSFGSLCKAAAISSAIRLLRWAVQRLSRARRWVGFFLDYILAWVQLAVDYVLAYTICFIGIYGLSFSEAGRRVDELFRKRGITNIANDSVVAYGLAMLAIVSTVGYIVVAWLFFLATSKTLSMLSLWGSESYWNLMLPMLYGYIACAIVISTTLEVVRSGFKAIFICFVQDPEVLAANHDRSLHSELSRAWQEMRVTCRDAPTPSGEVHEV